MTKGLSEGSVVRRDLTIVRKLGTGGYATVYAVRDPSVPEERALKIMHEEHMQSSSQIQRFVREAELLQRLRSPLLPRIFDAGQLESKQWYMLMELVEGETLNRVVKRERRLHWQRAVAIGIDVCDALSAAHAIGALHRDLKPHNLFVTTEGNIKVLDFGVATYVAGKTDRFGQLTQRNAAVGTPEYMSPELIRGKPLTPTSDLYMLGVVLYELLTGNRPFTGETLGDVLECVSQGQYAPVGSIAPDVPLAVVGIVEKAMRLDPDRRFQTAADMAVALRQALAEPMEPVSPSLVPPAPAFGEDNETLAPGTVTISMNPPPIEQPVVAAAPQAPPRPWARIAGLAAGAVGLVLLGVAAFFALNRQSPRSAPAANTALPPSAPTAASPTTGPDDDLPTGVLPPEEGLPTGRVLPPEEGLPTGELPPEEPEVEPSSAMRSPRRRPAPMMVRSTHDTTQELINMTGLADPFAD